MPKSPPSCIPLRDAAPLIHGNHNHFELRLPAVGLAGAALGAAAAAGLASPCADAFGAAPFFTLCVAFSADTGVLLLGALLAAAVLLAPLPLLLELGCAATGLAG